MKRWLSSLAILVLASVIFGSQSWTGFIRPGDDCNFGVIAENLASNGNFLKLEYRGRIFLEKPPLTSYFQAISIWIFSSTTFGLRFPSILLSIISAVGIFLLLSSPKVFGFIKDPWAYGIMTILIILSTQQLIEFARRPFTDSFLCYFYAFSFIFCFYGISYRPIYLLLAGFFCGLCVMTKGMAGLFPMAMIIVVILINNRALLKSVYFYLMLTVMLLISLPWHSLMLMTYGETFIHYYFGEYLGYINRTSGGPWYIYLRKLGENFEPWFLLFVPALSWLSYKCIKLYLSHKGSYKFINWALILLGWFFSIFVIYHLSSMKNYWYILPLYPAMAMILSLGIIQLKTRFRPLFYTGLAIGSVMTLIFLVISFTNLYPKLLDAADYRGDTALLNYFNTEDTFQCKIYVYYPLDYCSICDSLTYYSESEFVDLKGNSLKETLQKEAKPIKYLLFYKKDAGQAYAIIKDASCDYRVIKTFPSQHMVEILY